MLAWSSAAILYMAAAFFHNNVDHVYPLRVTYALFPLVYYVGVRHLETSGRGKGREHLLAVVVVLHVALNVVGVMLDPGTIGIRTQNVLRALFGPFKT